MTGRSITPPAMGTAVAGQRDPAARLVTCTFHLFRACLLHDDGNQSVQGLVPPVAEAVAACCARFEAQNVRLLLSRDMVFVNRKLLRAPREVYQLAQHLASMLERCGVNELRFERGVSASSLLQFSRLLADGQRSPAVAGKVRGETIPGVSARWMPHTDLERRSAPRESAAGHVAKNIAVSVLVVRSFLARMAWGERRGAHDIKKVAQKLVALHDAHPSLLIAAAAAPLSDGDTARRAVSSAILAIAMTRLLTDDRNLLASVAWNALLADVGQARMQGPEPPWERLPAATLLVMTEQGRFHTNTMVRGIVAYEALAMIDPDTSLDAAPRTPLVLGAIVNTARAFLDFHAPMNGTPATGLDVALRSLQMQRSGRIGSACVRLLEAAMGIVPAGKAVCLDTGEIALVLGPPARALDYARPPVRILTDAKGQLLDDPVDADLARPSAGQPHRAVHHTVDL